MTARQVPIHENYREYTPPSDVRIAVANLLAAIPDRYSLTELGAVVLTNGRAVGRGKTQRVLGRKYDRNSCCGFYHHRRNTSRRGSRLSSTTSSPARAS